MAGVLAGGAWGWRMRGTEDIGSSRARLGMEPGRDATARRRAAGHGCVDQVGGLLSGSSLVFRRRLPRVGFRRRSLAGDVQVEGLLVGELAGLLVTGSLASATAAAQSPALGEARQGGAGGCSPGRREVGGGMARGGSRGGALVGSRGSARWEVGRLAGGRQRRWSGGRGWVREWRRGGLLTFFWLRAGGAGSGLEGL